MKHKARWEGNISFPSSLKPWSFNYDSRICEFFFGMRSNGIMIFNHTGITPGTSQQAVTMRNHCFRKRNFRGEKKIPKLIFVATEKATNDKILKVFNKIDPKWSRLIHIHYLSHLHYFSIEIKYAFCHNCAPCFVRSLTICAFVCGFLVGFCNSYAIPFQKGCEWFITVEE